ncbi:MAG: hypothetical protein RJA44_1959 [Pseudomonadota bacterium]|jgi:hypothetical protein
MSRPLRPTLHWLLWLVLALLPLRGWAWAAMLPAEVAAAVASVTPDESADPLPPCHRTALKADGTVTVTDGGIAADDGAAADPSSPHPGCTLCSLCHAAAAPADMQLPALPALLPESPSVGPAAQPPGWRADTPERPPKA